MKIITNWERRRRLVEIKQNEKVPDLKYEKPKPGLFNGAKEKPVDKDKE